jgi:6-phosphofructokinase 1
MGRRAGYLALYAGIAVGATTILVPSDEFDMNKVLNEDILGRMLEAQRNNKKHFIIVVAEGIDYTKEIPDAWTLARTIEQRTAEWSSLIGKEVGNAKIYVEDGSPEDETDDDETTVETRATVLGYVQRGGSPSARDRMVASRMGFEAVKSLMRGDVDCVVAINRDKISTIKINEALAMTKELDPDLFEIAHQISI